MCIVPKLLLFFQTSSSSDYETFDNALYKMFERYEENQEAQEKIVYFIETSGKIHLMGL
uniref:Uncharacterized protein n=1 Tax=Arundo donax TaxID=35708 RepID=A0A0A9C3L5_ARUDO